MVVSFVSSIVGLSMTLFSIGMAHTFYRSKRKWWQVCICWLLFIVVTLFLTALLQPVLGNRAGQYCGFCALFAYAYLFDIPAGQWIFTYFFVDTSMYLTALVARYTALLAFTHFPMLDPKLYFAVLYFLLTAAYLFVFFRYFRKRIKNQLSQLHHSIGGIASFACVAYVALLGLFDAWEVRWQMSLQEYFDMLLFVGVIACGYYVSFYTISTVQKTAATNLHLHTLTLQAQQAESYYQHLSTHIEEVRRMNHDVSHHLRVLDAYARDGEIAQLRHYIATLSAQMPQSSGIHYCSDYTANVLISFFAEKAKEAGIVFSCDAQIPCNIMQEPIHLCIVLGNALQNALDACEYVKTEDAFISLVTKVVGKNLSIQVKNSFDGILVEENGQINSRKKEAGHGLGLSSMRSIVELYSGYFAVEHSNRLFKLQVVLPLSEDCKFH